jgi:dUTP pyrophosphatase
MKIQIKKIDPEAKVPKFSLEGDAAMDLYSAENVVIEPGEKIACKTGIAIKIPDGYAGLIWDKGSVGIVAGVKTLGGVFDSNYTGEWLIGLVNLGKEDYKIEKGQKIAQVIFQKIETPEIEEVEELEETNRGEGRFGHTGKF